MLDLDVSVWTSYYVDLSPEEMIDAYAEAGYRTAEFSDEHGAVLLERAAEQGITPAEIGAEVRAYAERRGVTFPQGHLFLKVDLCADGAVEVLKNWLDLFCALGIRAAVLHASGGRELTDEQRFDRWTDALRQLTAHLEGTDLSIALENVGSNPTAEHLNRLIDAVGDEHLGICLDTGHFHLAMASGAADYPQSEFIRRAGKRLIALHIADNDTSRDQHLMPFGCGTVDWKDVMRGLREAGYDRLFNYEIPGERRASLPVRRAKLDYIRAVTDELFADDFVK